MLDRIALDRAGDDDARPALDGLCLFQGGEHFIQIVPVDLLREPAECFPARHQRPQVEHLGGRSGLLIAVLIDDGDEIIRLELVRRHGGFPDLALIELAVAGHDVDAIVEPIEPRRQRVAQADRQALAQRACRCLYPGEPAHVRMAFQGAPDLAQGCEHIGGEVTGFGEHGVEQRGAVTFAQDEPIALGPARLLRVVAHDAAEVQRHGDLDAGQRAGRMSGAGLGGARDDVPANRLRFGLQLRKGNGLRAHNSLPPDDVRFC